LAPMRELAVLAPESSEHRFLWTRLIRQRNRIHDALLQACELLEGILDL
jgi:hypothetical protein